MNDVYSREEWYVIYRGNNSRWSLSCFTDRKNGIGVTFHEALEYANQYSINNHLLKYNVAHISEIPPIRFALPNIVDTSESFEWKPIVPRCKP